MAKINTTAPSTRDAQAFVREYCLVPLGEVFSSLLGTAVQCELSSDEGNPADPAAHFTIPLGDAGASLFVSFTESAGRELELQVARAVGLEAPANNQWSSLHEVCVKLGGQIAARLSAELGQQIGAGLVQPAEPAPTPGQVRLVGCILTQSGRQRHGLTIGISSELLEMVRASQRALTIAAESQPAPSNLDLFLDVELPVSISFGRTQIPLKDVIRLTTGSVVELSRSISEPVEVIVNNRVIARGEVVVVDGNFGVRIKEVASRQERLQTVQ